MPHFIWKGKNSYGEKRKGVIEAPNIDSARGHLKKIRITPTKLKEKPKDLFENIEMFKPKVTGKDVVIFTRQLSTMIDAGLPLVQGLEILGNQQENPTFKTILSQIRGDVETGTTFADALKKHPKIFDNLFCNMIEAGEIGGILDTILSRLSIFMEKSMTLKRRVKGAMTYPVICLCISVVILGVILIFVVPVFESMFADFGSALPGPTQIVVNISNFLKTNLLYGLAFFAACVFIFKKYYATDTGEKRVDALILQAPVFGDLIRKVAVAKFARTLGTMLKSGVPILESLQVVARTAGNRGIETAVFRTADAIS